MKVMNQRQHKVAEEVRHILASALLQGRVHSTLPLSRLTVLDVWVSADLKLARVFLAFPETLTEAEVLETANAELSKPLRKVLAGSMAGKSVPEITFWPLEDHRR